MTNKTSSIPRPSPNSGPAVSRETPLSTRLLALLAVAAFVGGAGCESCAGCGEEKPPPEPVDTQPAEPELQDDPLAGAAEEAREKAISVAVDRTDEARFLASDIAAREHEDEPSGPSTVPPDPEGSIDREALEKVFREHSRQTQECYERQLKTNPSLAGRIVLRITIGADGSVLEAQAIGESLRNEDINACLEQRVKSWMFPEPEGGAARVRKPFSFSPKQN